MISFFAFYVQNIHAIEFTRYTDKETKIEIFEFDGMFINEKCFKEKEKCLAYLIKKAAKAKPMIEKNKINAKKDIQAGHPASKFCNEAGGLSAIYKDKELNEHDYCEFDNTYFIDSWNFLKRFKR